MNSSEDRPGSEKRQAMSLMVGKGSLPLRGVNASQDRRGQATLPNHETPYLERLLSVCILRIGHPSLQVPVLIRVSPRASAASSF